MQHELQIQLCLFYIVIDQMIYVLKVFSLVVVWVASNKKPSTILGVLYFNQGSKTCLYGL